MLAPALGRHRGHGALDQFQQRLLHALPGHVPGDGGVVGLTGDLVNFVDIDDSDLGLVHVVIALLQQLLDDVLNILADVARLGEGSGVGDGEGNIKEPGQGLSQQGLTAAGGAHQQDIAFAQLHFVASLAVAQALVVVVNRH